MCGKDREGSNRTVPCHFREHAPEAIVLPRLPEYRLQVATAREAVTVREQRLHARVLKADIPAAGEGCDGAGERVLQSNQRTGHVVTSVMRIVRCHTEAQRVART